MCCSLSLSLSGGKSMPMLSGPGPPKPEGSHPIRADARLKVHSHLYARQKSESPRLRSPAAGATTCGPAEAVITLLAELNNTGNEHNGRSRAVYRPDFML